MIISRRDFTLGTAALAFAGSSLSYLPAAFAQKANDAALASAGPLGDMVQGKADAPVTVIEYASMTCGHCATFHTTTYPVFKQRYIDTGKAKYILREFPLDQLAAAGFMLARCAGDDRYYPMVDVLFSKQKDWVVQKPLPQLLAIAKQAGFTEASFNECLSNQKMLEGIEQVRNNASEKLNVNSTPTFFINGKLIRGGMTIEQMAAEIDPLVKA